MKNEIVKTIGENLAYLKIIELSQSVQVMGIGADKKRDKSLYLGGNYVVVNGVAGYPIIDKTVVSDSGVVDVHCVVATDTSDGMVFDIDMIMSFDPTTKVVTYKITNEGDFDLDISHYDVPEDEQCTDFLTACVLNPLVLCYVAELIGLAPDALSLVMHWRQVREVMLTTMKFHGIVIGILDAFMGTKMIDVFNSPEWGKIKSVDARAVSRLINELGGYCMDMNKVIDGHSENN